MSYSNDFLTRYQRKVEDANGRLCDGEVIEKEEFRSIKLIELVHAVYTLADEVKALRKDLKRK